MAIRPTTSAKENFMEFLFYLSLLTLFMVLVSNITLLLGQRSIKFLKDISPANQSTWPEVSIIIPARNEERNLEEALRSVLSLDYPRYQVLVVNDRSTDGTRDLLERLDPHDAKLRVFHIENLPARVGWARIMRCITGHNTPRVSYCCLPMPTLSCNRPF